MAKEKGRKLVAQNRKARHDYHIHDTCEAGLVLSGTEVKSLREGRATLTDAFATVDDGEVWLRSAHIPEYSHGTWTNHTARRTRKLLLQPQGDRQDRARAGRSRARRWCRWPSTSPTGTPRWRSPSPPASASTTSARPSRSARSRAGGRAGAGGPEPGAVMSARSYAVPPVSGRWPWRCCWSRWPRALAHRDRRRMPPRRPDRLVHDQLRGPRPTAWSGSPRPSPTGSATTPAGTASSATWSSASRTTRARTRSTGSPTST